MSTLADVKARIADELNRDDLSDQIADRITRAIYYYGAKRFWFNEQRIAGVTITGNQYVATPDGTRVLDGVWITVGGYSYELDPRPMTLIEEYQALATTMSQPTDYAYFNSQIRLYATPNDAYPLNFIGIFDLPALTDDSGSNVWTTEAEDLIVARVTGVIQRDIIRDDTCYARCVLAEKEAMAALKYEGAMKMSTGVRGWQ